MSAISLRELRALRRAGLGQGEILSIVGGLVGPLAEAGVTAYSTYAQQDLANKDLKQRQAEVSALLAQRDKEVKVAAMQQQIEAKNAAIQGAISSQLLSQNVKIGLGVLALVTATVAVYKGVKAYRGRS